MDKKEIIEKLNAYIQAAEEKAEQCIKEFNRDEEISYMAMAEAYRNSIKVIEALSPVETQIKCNCNNIEIGSYDNQIWVHAPAHMPKDNGYCLDRCIAEEVMQLWMKGIVTTGSCCGHNKVPRYIGVDEKDIDKMKELGYVVLPNSLDASREDSFVPKSIKPKVAVSNDELKFSNEDIKKRFDEIDPKVKEKVNAAFDNSELLERAKEEVAKTRKGLTFERMNFLHGDYWIDEDIVNKVAIRFSQLSKEEDAVSFAELELFLEWAHRKEWRYNVWDDGKWHNRLNTNFDTTPTTELYNIYKLNK